MNNNYRFAKKGFIEQVMNKDFQNSLRGNGRIGGVPSRDAITMATQAERLLLWEFIIQKTRNDVYFAFMNYADFQPPAEFVHILVWLIPVILIELVLKGFALWRAGRNNHPVWFVVLLIVNSIGILPLIYLLAFDTGKKAVSVKAKKKK